MFKSIKNFLLAKTLVLLLVISNEVGSFKLQHPEQTVTEQYVRVYTDPPPSNSELGIYDQAAVSTDGYPCSEIGVDILKMNGTAVDAAIATMFCVGFTVAESMGLGGGFLLTYYDRSSRRSYALDARETAPSAASEDMYGGDSQLSAYGGLSIAIPGAPRGYWELYQRFGGSVSWSDLIEPTIALCEEGYPVSPHMANALNVQSSYILNEPSMSMYVDPDTGNVWQEGDIRKNPKLAATLRVIQQEPDALNSGSLSDTFLADLQNVSSIIVRSDLENYRPIWRDSVAVDLQNGGYILHSVPPPGSGIIIGFILNILDNYNFTSDALAEENIVTTYQRVAESFKYAYARRTEMGDESFVNMTELIANLTSDDYERDIYMQITDNMTFQDPSYYGAVTYTPESKGTSHLAVLAPNGDAVSVTSTINLYFGAVVASASTGIVLNDEMDDFSSPNITNAFGFPPSPANFIVPGKRPVSSMSPTVLTDATGDVRLITGASGGSMISTSTAWQAMHYLWFGDDVKESVDRRRLHHQLLPMVLEYEEDFRMDIIEGLEAIGHNTSEFSLGQSVVCSIAKELDGKIYANSDFRKAPDIDGF